MPIKDAEKRREYQREWDRKNRKGKRHQVWLGIFYPDDCPGWEQDMEENGVPCLVSPLHDMDVWTEHDVKKYPDRHLVAGQFKRAHRHIVVEYPAVVDYETFVTDFAFLAKDSERLKHVKFAKSISASTLYLAHETDACRRLGKVPYDTKDVLEFCGANYLDWKARVENVHEEMKKMRRFIRENGVIEFTDFQDWCDEENDEWSRLLDLKCAWAIGNYIDRMRNRLKEQAKAQRFLE